MVFLIRKTKWETSEDESIQPKPNDSGAGDVDELLDLGPDVDKLSESLAALNSNKEEVKDESLRFLCR